MPEQYPKRLTEIPAPDRHRYGAWLRELMAERHLGPADVAARTGYSAATLEAAAAGDQLVGERSTKAVAELLDAQIPDDVLAVVAGTRSVLSDHTKALLAAHRERKRQAAAIGRLTAARHPDVTPAQVRGTELHQGIEVLARAQDDAQRLAVMAKLREGDSTGIGTTLTADESALLAGPDRDLHGLLQDTVLAQQIELDDMRRRLLAERQRCDRLEQALLARGEQVDRLARELLMIPWRPL